MSTAGFIRVTIAADHADAAAVQQAVLIFMDRWPAPVHAEFTDTPDGIQVEMTLPRNASPS